MNATTITLTADDIAELNSNPEPQRPLSCPTFSGHRLFGVLRRRIVCEPVGFDFIRCFVSKP